MTHMQQAQRRTTVMTSAVVAAAISIAITTSLGAILVGVMVTTGTLSLPAAQPDAGSTSEISPALAEAGREWQRQGELLSRAFVEPITSETFSDDWWYQFAEPYVRTPVSTDGYVERAGGP